MKGRSEWNWLPPPDEGIWRHGAAWMRPFAVSAPWITLAILLVMFGLIGDRLAAAPGVVFDLPAPAGRQTVAAGATMLVLPSANAGETGGALVFFDDARYVLDDPQSAALLRDQLVARVQENAACATLLVLADRRVACGDLMRLAAVAKRGGVAKVLFAEKRPEAVE